MTATEMRPTCTTHPGHAMQDFAVVPASTDIAVWIVSIGFLRINKMIGILFFFFSSEFPLNYLDNVFVVCKI